MSGRVCEGGSSRGCVRGSVRVLGEPREYGRLKRTVRVWLEWGGKGALGVRTLIFALRPYRVCVCVCVCGCESR